MTRYLTHTCLMCEGVYRMKLTQEEANAIDLYAISFRTIQELLPHFNPVEREFVKSGYCPGCQEVLFGTSYKSRRISRV